MRDDQGAPAPGRYEIVVRHHLGPRMLSAFPGLTGTHRDGATVLTGTLQDQKALYAVLAKVEDLGLELLELRRVMPTEEGPR
ncbi:MAG TPA: hypothetical protein VMU14_16865 [Acidimicrobiales bacterium]|nr:hypothetical protein [Acidimicrobiales bacterium]